MVPNAVLIFESAITKKVYVGLEGSGIENREMCLRAGAPTPIHWIR
jgi:hypothetical protein